MIQGMVEVGKVQLNSDVVINTNHEVAAWFTKSKIEAGTHSVFLAYSDYKSEFGLHLVDDGAVIIDDHTPSMYGGVQVSEGNSKAGQKTQESIRLYAENGEIKKDNGPVSYEISELPDYISFDGKSIVVDVENEAFKAIQKQQRVELFHKIAQDPYSGHKMKELYENHWKDSGDLDKLVDLGFLNDYTKNYWSFDYFNIRDRMSSKLGGIMKVDDILRNYYQTSLLESGVDFDKTVEIYNSMNGSVSNFAAWTVKRLEEEGYLDGLNPKAERDNEFVM